MNRRHFSILPLILTLLFFAPFTHAQQTNSDKTQTGNTVLQEKAFNLLESLVDQISTLQSAENRARLRSNIAGSLWTHDEKRARALLVAVEDDIKAGLQNSLADDPVDVQTLRVFVQLRVNTVERIAKYDPELALAFFKNTEIVSDKPLPTGVAESERAVEANLAKELARSNPELALKLGRELLARGFSIDLISLLSQLNRKNKELAQALYQEIVSKLRKSNPDSQVMYFAQTLAYRFKPPKVEDQPFRELIGRVIEISLANGCGEDPNGNDSSRYLCYQNGPLISDMLRIDPMRAAPLKRWGREEWTTYPPPEFDEGVEGLGELNENSSIDELLALASKYPTLANEIYWKAIIKAEVAGDFERARGIATEHISDPERRQAILARIDRDQKASSFNDEQVAKIQIALGRLRTREEKLGFLLSMADRASLNDRKIALKFLNQAANLVETIKPGRTQMQAQLALAFVYCSVKSDRGFEIMESLVPKLNELVSAAMKLENYDNGYVRDGEWNMTGEGGLGSLMTNLANNAGYFAWCDFDRAVSLAAQFERPEIRLMAQLKLAQAILAGPPKRLTTYMPVLD